MVALIRYNLAAVVHGQRYLAPLLIFAITLSVFTINDQGPLTGSYVAAAGALLLTMCWLTVTIINHEDPVRRSILIVLAGSSTRVLFAEVLLALLAGLALTLVGLIFPILSGQHLWAGTDLAAGAAALLTAAFTGTAVGVLCCRLMVPRPGYSLLLALVVVIALPLAHGLPPVNPMLRTLASSSPPVDQVAPLAGDLLISLVLLALCVAAARFTAARRD
jgi:hypothetical protein